MFAHKYHLELPAVEIVTDDYLMAVPFESGAGFGDQEGLVRFQLPGELIQYESMRRWKTHLERDDVPVSGPLVYHWLEDLGYLVHFDVQTSLAGLNLMFRLGGPISTAF